MDLPFALNGFMVDVSHYMEEVWVVEILLQLFSFKQIAGFLQKNI